MMKNTKSDDHDIISLAATLAALRDLQYQRDILALFEDLPFGDEIFDGALDLTGEIR